MAWEWPSYQAMDMEVTEEEATGKYLSVIFFRRTSEPQAQNQMLPKVF